MKKLFVMITACAIGLSSVNATTTTHTKEANTISTVETLKKDDDAKSLKKREKELRKRSKTLRKKESVLKKEIQLNKKEHRLNKKEKKIHKLEIDKLDS
jgi:hypothetical protein